MHLIDVPTQTLAFYPATLVHLPNPLDPLDSLPKPPSALFNNPCALPPSGLPSSTLPHPRLHTNTSHRAPSGPSPSPPLHTPEDWHREGVQSAPYASFDEYLRDGDEAEPDVEGGGGESLDASLKLRRKLAEVLRHRDLPPLPPVPRAFHLPCGAGQESGSALSPTDRQVHGTNPLGPISGPPCAVYALTSTEAQVQGTEPPSPLSVAGAPPSATEHPEGSHSSRRVANPIPRNPAGGSPQGLAGVDAGVDEEGVPQPSPLPPRLRVRAPLNFAADSHAISHAHENCTASAAPHAPSPIRTCALAFEAPGESRIPLPQVPDSGIARAHLNPALRGNAGTLPGGMPAAPSSTSPTYPTDVDSQFLVGSHPSTTTKAPIYGDTEGGATCGGTIPHLCAHPDPVVVAPRCDTSALGVLHVEPDPTSRPMLAAVGGETPHFQQEYNWERHCEPGLVERRECGGEAGGHPLGNWQDARPQREAEAVGHLFGAWREGTTQHDGKPAGHPPGSWQEGAQESNGKAAAHPLGSWREGTCRREDKALGAGGEGEREATAWCGQAPEADPLESQERAVHGPAVHPSTMHAGQVHATAHGYQEQQDGTIAGQLRGMHQIALGADFEVQDTASGDTVPQGSTAGKEAEGTNAGQQEMENGNPGQLTALQDVTAMQNVSQSSAIHERAVQCEKYAGGTHAQEGPRRPGRRQALGDINAEAEIASEWAAAQLCSSRQLIDKVKRRQ